MSFRRGFAMTRCGRVVGVCAALSGCLVLSGCLNQEPLGKLAESKDTPFVLNVPQAEVPTTTARFQRADLPEPPRPVYVAQVTQAGGPLPLPPTPGLPGNSTNGIQQTSALTVASIAPPTVRICACVN